MAGGDGRTAVAARLRALAGALPAWRAGRRRVARRATAVRGDVTVRRDATVALGRRDADCRSGRAVLAEGFAATDLATTDFATAALRAPRRTGRAGLADFAGDAGRGAAAGMGPLPATRSPSIATLSA